MSRPDTKLRIFFVEMLGEPGTYDASVYDSFVDKDQEGLWFKRRYAYLGDVRFEIRSLPRGDSLPAPSEADGFVLGGSYNSVHDNYPWQRAVLSWLPAVRQRCLPLLAICGAHQLLGKHYGVSVTRVDNAPCAGTLPVSLTAAGMESPLLKSVAPEPRFHFGNEEQVASVPRTASLLATSDRVPVAALAYGDHWYSTQFHPEASAETMGISWAHSKPALCDAYDDSDAGDQVIENFVDLVRQSVNGQS
ncbi:MAG: type 1 glutamine amidotransferase [Acidiferrobacterales bacterium]